MITYRSIKRILLLSIALLIGLFITLANATEPNYPFYWDFINVNISVQTNGDMLVTETQKYIFNTAYTNQRYRYIPLGKVDDIEDITITDNGKTIPSQTGRENNQLWIRWEHELNPPEAHTFVLRYRVVGGLHVDSQNTQVYWKAIFAERQAPVQTATVKVQLPEALSGKVFSFTNFGVSASAREVDARTFEFVADQPLQPGQELEVQVTFPTGILNLAKPSWQQGNLLGSGFYIIQYPFYLLVTLSFIIGIALSLKPIFVSPITRIKINGIDAHSSIIHRVLFTAFLSGLIPVFTIVLIVLSSWLSPRVWAVFIILLTVVWVGSLLLISWKLKNLRS